MRREPVEHVIEAQQAAERAAVIPHVRLRKRPRDLAVRLVGEAEPGVEVSSQDRRLVTGKRFAQSARLARTAVLRGDPAAAEPDQVVEVDARDAQRPWRASRRPPRYPPGDRDAALMFEG